MKPHFFRTEQRVMKLTYVAGLWIDTPWMVNSDQRGVGVACHNLPRAIYLDCGALAPGFPKVIGDPVKSKHVKTSVMADFLDGRPEFRRLEPGEPRLPGDLLGLRVYSCVDHLGVLLPGNLFIHVLYHKKTSFDSAAVPPWSNHVEAVWRPLE